MMRRPAVFRYRNIAGLTMWLRGLLIADVVKGAILLWLELLDQIRLQRAMDGAPDPDLLIVHDGQAEFLPPAFLISLYAVEIVTLLVLAWWIYAAARNCHAVSGKGLAYSPGWSVGWFFVPVANLYKPWHALLQTWNVSADPDGDPERRAPAFLMMWWLVRLIGIAASGGIFKNPGQSGDLAGELALSRLGIVSSICAILTSVGFYLVVTRIARMQSAHFTGRPTPSRVALQP